MPAFPLPAEPPSAAGETAQRAARLAQLKAAPRKPGEASFFFYEAHFKANAVKVLPGEYFVDADDDLLIMTTLGSCIAACLWDRHARIGGMNHFMLPETEDRGGGASGRYGSYAMELLINELLKRGAARSRLEAKVFGGGQVLGTMQTLNIGERNTAFVLEYLRTEHIPVVSKDVLDIYPRKVGFMPASGRAMVKRLAPTAAAAVLSQEREAAERSVREGPSAGGSIDLF